MGERIDLSQFQKTLHTMDREDLPSRVDSSFDHADDSWQVQKEAVRAIELDNDGEAGEDKLRELEKLLDDWIMELELIEDGLEKIREGADKATVHERKSDLRTEENDQRDGYFGKEVARALKSKRFPEEEGVRRGCNTCNGKH